MKKYGVSLMVILLTVLLSACSVRTDENSPQTEETETQVSEEDEETPPTEGDEQENEPTYDSPEVQEKEDTVDEQEEGAVIEEPEEKEEEPTIDGSEEEYPGADVVEIVNLRGDETTVYKLADGTYMDRIERRFTYNGTATWTDEDGAEWNEVVR